MNNQAPESEFSESFPESPDSPVFLVNSVWPTIQGEGPFAGRPATFIRLAGCNLQCPGCDTEYSKRSPHSVAQLVEMVEQHERRLVVITGGEPFRHKELAKLVQALSVSKSRFDIQIETNGTFKIRQIVSQLATVVCSPKTPRLHESCSYGVGAWKYVISHDSIDPSDGLPTSVLGMQKPPCRPMNNESVYLQPADSKDPAINAMNVQAAVEICQKFGYTLCLQIQKIVGLK